MSDASVSLWRMDGSAAKKREREPGEADDDEGAAATATCLPCVAERVPCPSRAATTSAATTATTYRGVTSRE